MELPAFFSYVKCFRLFLLVIESVWLLICLLSNVAPSQVKYGPNSDRTHEDVQSLSDLHQWMQVRTGKIALLFLH